MVAGRELAMDPRLRHPHVECKLAGLKLLNLGDVNIVCASKEMQLTSNPSASKSFQLLIFSPSFLVMAGLQCF